MWAPEDHIDFAEHQAERTADARARARERAAAQRDKSELAYREELAAAIEQWLDFTDDHRGLAQQIAGAAADHDAVNRLLAQDRAPNDTSPTSE